MRRNFVSLSIILFIVILVGCKPDTIAYNSNTGHDGSRDSATQLLINSPRTDSISAPEGDNEDWYFFVPQEEGLITLSLNIDKPAEMEGQILLLDAFGQNLNTMGLSKGQSLYEFPSFSVKPDRYFVALKCTAGSSPYTIRASFSLPPPPPPVEEPPEIEPEPSKRCVPISRCNPKRGDRCCRPKETKPVESEDETVIPATAKTVIGTIVLVTPREDALADIKINGIGKRNGVRPGAKAVLRGLKRKVSIYACQTTYCNATVKATSADLDRYDKVEVVLDE
ncbi:MAG: hypothetical protein WC966_01235 [Bradymonadales bacterium]|jgi:hypothetical protein